MKAYYVKQKWKLEVAIAKHVKSSTSYCSSYTWKQPI